MSLTEENIEEINEAFQRLDPQGEFEIDVTKLDVGDEKVFITFPRDDAEINASVLMKYIKEFDSLKFSEEKVTSNRFTQIPVYSFGKPLDFIINEINFSVEVAAKYKIRLVDNPILIGIAATKLDLYDKYAPPCSSYIGIEIEYDTVENRLSEDEELKVLKAFLFELSYLSDSSIDFTVIHDSGYFDEYEEPERQHITLDSIANFSEGMDLYRKALNSSDDEISFLYFYKIIEYYSPIAARTQAYETLSKKIESLRYKTPSNGDLSAVFSIADKFRVSLSDKELAQTLLSSSIDVVDLFPKLPEAIKKRIAKMVHFNSAELNYGCGSEILQGIVNSLGLILYSTRNSIAHAKSNYKRDFNECDASDLSVFNEFLKAACYSIIKWHNRLPDHLKFDE